MPEGPELHLASKFVNTCCRGRIFSGKIVKNPVHKSSDIEFEAPAYSIAAASRGKEMQLVLTKLDSSSDIDNNGNKAVRKTGNRKSEGCSEEKDSKKLKFPETLKILFRFGMSGNFQFTTPTLDDIHKHSHLRFFTKDKPAMVLSYVDIRRFGRWEVCTDWSQDRGPDPMFEYQAFRSNVVNNIQKAAFDQPICEVLLNQKFFNGIGNYLRAEILFRLSIPPFEKARNVLEGLSEEPPDVKPLKGGKGKGEKPDILHLCHTVPLEVIAIGAGGYTADGKASDYSDFMKWLQCYYQDDMNNMVDHNKRTIWFSGPPGPMVPKDGKSRTIRSPKKRKQATSTDDVEIPVKMKESDNDISQKGGKSKSKKTAKTISKSARSHKAATASRKREGTAKNGKGDESTKKGSKNSKTKKGREDRRTSPSIQQHQSATTVDRSKKGKINTRTTDSCEHSDSKTHETGQKGRRNLRSRTRRVATKQ